jgi:hypothetical protein
MTEDEKKQIREEERIRIQERRRGRRGYGLFVLACLAGIVFLIWRAAQPS